MDPIMEIEIKGYCSLINATLPIKSGVTIITGPSNVGKSSIIKGIQQTLFNPTGSLYINNLLGKTVINIKYKGNDITFTRSNNSSVKYNINGSIYDKVSDQPEVISNIGFTKGSLISSETVNFWTQSSLPFLIYSTPKDRYEILSNGVNGLEDVRELMVADQKTLQSDIKVNTSLIESLESDTNRLKSLVKSEDFIQELTKLSVDLNKNYKVYSKLIEDLTKLNNLLNMKQVLSTSLETLKVKVSSIKAKLTLFETNLETLKKLQSSIDLINQNKAKITLLESQKSNLKQQLEELKSTLEHIDVCPLCNRPLEGGLLNGN